ncbi:kinase-like domain-containing protein, partial [Lophiotrema nucula]
EYPRHQYHLQHTQSMVNLHDDPALHASQRTPSPSVSSVSSTTSRSATPTSLNPWSSVMASPSSSTSSNTTSSSGNSPVLTPQYTSRSTTPVAPQPVRPINRSAGFIPMSPPPVGDSFRGSDYPGSPISNFPGSPNPYRQNTLPLQLMTNGFITPAVLAQGQSLSGWFYDLSRKQGWEAQAVKRVWQWSLSNPRTALLLVLCDDVASWRSAMFWDLRDEKLPFSEAALDSVVQDWRKVLDLQWRVTAKELPLKGGHVDFTARETVPLEQLSAIKPTGSLEKSVDRVRMLGDSDERVLVRKRFVLTRSTQKVVFLKQIQDFKQLDHKNIGRLLCSYAQPSHVGIVTAAAQYSLDDYLAMPGDSNRSRLLIDWMHDLSSGLEYLHTQSISHKNIRPRKILIDGSRIFFSAFGIGNGSGTLSPTSLSSQRLDQLSAYFQDQSYIYAAPEAIVSRGKKPGRPADVFSLGCVFLSMMTVAQNQHLSHFTSHRASSSQDASFHAHLDRVGTWRLRLLAVANSGLRSGTTGSGRRQRQLRTEAEWLQIIERMIQAEPMKRTKMKKIMSYLTELGEGRVSAGRRRSLDGGGFSGQIAHTLGMTNGTNSNSNTERRPELSVFDGYFEEQGRR